MPPTMEYQLMPQSMPKRLGLQVMRNRTNDSNKERAEYAFDAFCLIMPQLFG